MENKESKLNKKKSNKTRKHSDIIQKAVYNEFIYSPSLQSVSGRKVFAGYYCRAFLAFILSFGITLFVADAFKVSMNIPVMILTGVLCCGIFATMALKKLYFAVGSAVSVIALLVSHFIAFGNPIISVPNSIVLLYNGMLDRLDRVGYKISDIYLSVLDSGAIYTQEQEEKLAFAGLLLVMAVLCAVFSLCTLKKVHLLPILIIGTSVIVLVCTYNIAQTNWGFALVIAAVCGIVTLKSYDGMYNLSEHEKKKKKSLQTNITVQKNVELAYCGGFASVAACVLSFIIVLVPALTLDDQWSDISFISDKMDYARAVVTSVLTGENADVDFGYSGNMDTMNARSTVAENRTYTGKQMLTVYSSYCMPAYLRSWISSEYDNDENSWISASSSKIKQYSSVFGEDFAPEDITLNFYEIINPKLLNVPGLTTYFTHFPEGFITQTFDIENIGSNGNLLFLTSLYNKRIGLLNFLSTDKTDVYSGENNNYYEGMVSTSWFNMNKSYRFVSFVTTYRDENYAENLSNNLQYFDIMCSYIDSLSSATRDDAVEQSVLAEAENVLDGYGIEYEKPTVLERYIALDDDERKDFYEEYIAEYRTYSSFVYSSYLSTPSSKYLDKIAQEIAKKWYEDNGLEILYINPLAGSTAGEYVTAEDAPFEILYDEEDGRAYRFTEDGTAEYLTIYYYGMSDTLIRHQLVMSVVDYLKDNYTYTLNPKSPKNKMASALDSFLGDTKEGYCVQFATAAAMILREFGVPTRYVEGYYLNDFKYDKSEDRIAKYSQVAKDSNAHAWIEVYLDGAGWMTYETTPVYYNDMYEVYSGSSEYEPANAETDPPETETETETEIETEAEEDDDESDDEKAINPRLIKNIIITVSAVVICAIIAYYLYRYYEKVVRSYEKRYEAINRGLQTKLDGDELREVGRVLNDYIWQLHKVAGVTPNDGELPAEYGARVDSTINDSLFRFKDILSYMSDEEFGNGMERWKLHEEAEYTQILWNKLYSEMPLPKRIYWRYFRRMI